MGLNWTRQFERVTCPFCGRRISAWVPHGGNGSDVKIVRHKTLLYGVGRVDCPASEQMHGVWRRHERGRPR